MNTTEYNIPVSVTILTRSGDNSGSHPQLKFRLCLECDGRAMETDYSGGVLAFGARESRAVKIRLADEHRKCGTNGPLTHVLNGHRLIDKKVEENMVDFLASVAVIDVAGVCYSLLQDGRCAEGSFEDFCADCGYDTDSRKALETYLACQKNGADFRALVRNHYGEIETALEDY